jgi:energy-converting hydrogenase Eha subunit C
MQNVFLVSDVYLYVIGVAIIVRLAPTQKLRTVLLILSNLFILTFLASYREIIIATLAYAVLCIAFAEGLYRFRDKGFAKAVTLG